MTRTLSWFPKCAQCGTHRKLQRKPWGIVLCDSCNERMEQDIIDEQQADIDDENSREMANQVANDARFFA